MVAKAPALSLRGACFAKKKSQLTEVRLEKPIWNKEKNNIDLCHQLATKDPQQNLNVLRDRSKDFAHQRSMIRLQKERKENVLYKWRLDSKCHSTPFHQDRKSFLHFAIWMYNGILPTEENAPVSAPQVGMRMFWLKLSLLRT